MLGDKEMCCSERVAAGFDLQKKSEAPIPLLML